MVSNTVNPLQTVEVDPAAARGQIERLIASKTFEGSDVHRRLLHFLAATVLFVKAHRQAEPVAESWTPELESLWQPFLQSKRALVVCLGTPLFVRFPAFGFFRDPKANDWQEIEKSERITAARQAMGDK